MAPPILGQLAHMHFLQVQQYIELNGLDDGSEDDVASEDGLDERARVAQDAHGVPHRPRRLPFDIESWDSKAILRQFRFSRNDLYRIIHLLRLPFTLHTASRGGVDAIEALCTVLYRLSSPVKLDRLEPVFNRDLSAIPRIILFTVAYILSTWEFLLNWDRFRLTRNKLSEFAHLIQEFTGVTDRVFGFVDGTLRRIARPDNDVQECLYSGHKRHHGLKYVGIVTPDSILIHLAGPDLGHAHDSTVFRRSNIHGLLRKTCVQCFERTIGYLR